jgi:hypothetical protein
MNCIEALPQGSFSVHGISRKVRGARSFYSLRYLKIASATWAGKEQAQNKSILFAVLVASYLYLRIMRGLT